MTNQSPAERILALYKTAVLHDYRCKKNDCYQVDDTEQEHHGITLLQAKTQLRDALLEQVDELEENLRGRGEDDNIEAWKNGVRSIITKVFTK